VYKNINLLSSGLESGVVDPSFFISLKYIPDDGFELVQSTVNHNNNNIKIACSSARLFIEITKKAVPNRESVIGKTSISLNQPLIRQTKINKQWTTNQPLDPNPIAFPSLAQKYNQANQTKKQWTVRATTGYRREDGWRKP
jgi:hypothetical protein